MVPWPIALLTLFYGLLAAVTGAAAWKILTGAADRPLLWPAVWLGLSVAVMCGLPLLKPWARRLAIAGSAGLGLVTLGFALLIAGSGRPGLGVMGALLAGTHLVVIRYLRRPEVKRLFLRASS
ncbi:MAG: hypothetical protein A3B78_01430 [Omnitrophica WOR_2 bacterium RIFCSPHIGHO2_02_FULL_67_20]|nr:MAG: hypothetical protein A3B78_01430 [Omnitrophica WOR_2 bacterium RIFCSPHIGHO2_02_FULL_67_20]